ncbi:MAG: hypothetical protein LRZ91_01915 [Desulfotomaculum sp.]|nr:hypothetical protein [Desulfotomaculum sp.]
METKDNVGQKQAWGTNVKNLLGFYISDKVVPYGYRHSIEWSDYYTTIKQFGKILKELL